MPGFRPCLDVLESRSPLSAIGVSSPTYSPSAAGVMTPLNPPSPNDPDGGAAFYQRYTVLPPVGPPPENPY